MKTITPEIRKQIFAQYFGFTYYYKNEFGTYREQVEFGYHTNRHIESDKAFLYLTPLSKITDEDKMMVCELQGKDYSKEKGIDMHFDLTDIKCFSLCIQHDEYKHDYYECVELRTSQYLQSKGYAMPYLNYSVLDLVELNVIKLKK